MKRLLGSFVIVALLGLMQLASAADIKVMTQNQYLGADLTPVFTALNETMFNEAAVAALRQIAATQPTVRIKALANEIVKGEPALVGLQEVEQLSCTDLVTSVPGLGCDDPSIRDAFGDRLLETLTALGESYVERAIVTNLSVEVDLLVNSLPVRVGAVDRAVILARSDIPWTPVVFPPALCLKPSDQGCNYSNVLPLTLKFFPFTTIYVERGFVAVDAMVDGKAYRFVNTHLEEKHLGTDAAPIQAAQAAELIQILQILQATSPDDSLLVVGDTNSSPTDLPIPIPGGTLPTPYQQFVLLADYTDAWLLRPGKVPGLTCCQLADLSNHNSDLYERVDMLFSLDPPAKVKQARVVGATVSDKTPPPGRGLWPSDHGAVTAELQFE